MECGTASLGFGSQSSGDLLLLEDLERNPKVEQLQWLRCYQASHGFDDGHMPKALDDGA
jgi:hypothetical protein